MSVANDNGNVSCAYLVHHELKSNDFLIFLLSSLSIIIITLKWECLCSLTRGGGCHAAWPGIRCTSTWVTQA